MTGPAQECISPPGGVFGCTFCAHTERTSQPCSEELGHVVLADFVFAESMQLLNLVYKYKKSGVDLWRCTRADMAEQSCIDAAVIAEYALKSLETGQETKIL